MANLTVVTSLPAGEREAGVVDAEMHYLLSEATDAAPRLSLSRRQVHAVVHGFLREMEPQITVAELCERLCRMFP